MKNLMTFLLTLFLTTSCEKAYIDSMQENELQSKRVRFEITNGQWEVVTRALSADGQEMTDLWLFDYMDGELVRTLHKSQGDVDFDTPNLQMKYGEHIVYIVSSRGVSPIVNETIIEWQKPSDTFWKAVTVNVGSGSGESVDVMLDRVATRFRVSVKDEIPEGASQLCITPSEWFYGLDYLTGEAVSPKNQERVVTIPASYVSTTGQLTASIFGLSDEAEWMTDVTITAKNSEGSIIGSVSLYDVEFTRNRTTTASGNLFAGEYGFSITLNEIWNNELNIEW